MTPKLDRWKARAAQLAGEVHALALATRDPRVPWYAKVLAGSVVAYALSPIDLIPDPIPLLGYADDLVLVPLGILLVRRLIPADVLSECRVRAAAAPLTRKSWVAAGVIVALWIAAATAAIGCILRAWSR